MGITKINYPELVALDNASENIVTALTGKMPKVTTMTPVNAVNATGTLTFTDVVADGQTVTIGTEVYEFKTSGSATGTNIKVDVASGQTAANACTALISTIGGNSSSVVTIAAGTGTSVVVTAKVAGAAANSITTTTTCTNGSWGAATLASGVDGTVASNASVWGMDSNYVYFVVAANTISGKNWRRISLGSAY